MVVLVGGVGVVCGIFPFVSIVGLNLVSMGRMWESRLV